MRDDAAEWSIHDLARAAGVTSRTLRHYGQVGLLPPSRTGSNGYRYYDTDGLVRLQRILLLRDLGLGLAAIAQVLDGQRDAAAALRTHLALLESERERIDRLIKSVRTTLHKTERGERVMADEAFDGFDHTQYEQEVTERWGREAYQRGDRWWRSLSEGEKARFAEEGVEVAKGFAAAAAAGRLPDSDEAQELARRQVDWLSATTSGPQEPTRSHVTGLGEMYVEDPRFARYYDQHGPGTAVLVRDALAVYGERHLAD